MVSVLAGASAVWLSVGWWWQKQALLEWGLLMAAPIKIEHMIQFLAANYLR